MSSKQDDELKIIVIGESGVGKTSLSRRFELDEFRTSVKETVLVDFWKKKLLVGGKSVNIVVYDTAGQERYKSLVSGYFRNVDGVLLVYDVTNIMTFNKISGWLTQAKNLSPGAVALIVGNKSDHPSGKAVTRDTVRRFARDEGLEFMLTSAKEGRNVQQVFEYLTLKILLKKGLIDPDSIDNIFPNHESDDEAAEDPAQVSSENVTTPDAPISNNITYSKESFPQNSSEEPKQKAMDLSAPSTSTNKNCGNLSLNSSESNSKVNRKQQPTACLTNNDQIPSIVQKKNDESVAGDSIDGITKDTQQHTRNLAIKNNNQIFEPIPSTLSSVSQDQDPDHSDDEASFVIVQVKDISRHLKFHSPNLPPVVPLSDDVSDLCLIRHRRRMSSDSLSSLATETNEEFEAVIKLHQEARDEERRGKSKTKCCVS